MKIICQRFCTLAVFTFWDICTHICEMFVYKHTETIESPLIAYLLRKIQTSWVNNSRIFRFNYAKFPGHCFCMNPKWTYSEIFKSALVYLKFVQKKTEKMLFGYKYDDEEFDQVEFKICNLMKCIRGVLSYLLKL